MTQPPASEERSGQDPRPATSPTYSPDGRWFWDGSAWRPVSARETQATVADPALQRRARWLMLLLGAGAIGIVVLVTAYVLYQISGTAGSTPDQWLQWAFLWVFVLLYYVLLAITAAAFVAVAALLAMWCFRAYRNLSTLGAAGLAWTPQWAALAWFIPAANVVVPFLVLREVWSVTRRPTERLLWWLWIWEAVWVTANAAAYVPQAVAGNTVLSSVATDGFWLVVAAATALLIPTVNVLTRRQQERLSQAA